jgi:hypothetical protein
MRHNKQMCKVSKWYTVFIFLPKIQQFQDIKRVIQYLKLKARIKSKGVIGDRTVAG